MRDGRPGVSNQLSTKSKQIQLAVVPKTATSMNKTIASRPTQPGSRRAYPIDAAGRFRPGAAITNILSSSTSLELVSQRQIWPGLEYVIGEFPIGAVGREVDAVELPTELQRRVFPCTITHATEYPMHLEILVDRMKREFKVDANVGAPQVAYRETITRSAEIDYTHKKQTGGSE